MKKDIILFGIILILLGVAVVLGYAIYRQTMAPPLSEEKAAPPESVPSAQAPEIVQPQNTGDELTEEQRAVLATPAPNASEAEKQKHFQLAQSLAKSASYLDITKCSLAEPLVLKIEQGRKFIARNEDVVEHVIVMDAKRTFSVPSKGTKEITADFGHGPGLYGFGCDTVPHAVGMFLVTPAVP